MPTQSRGTPLTTQRFRKFSGVVIANLPEIDSELASDFESNGDAVAIILEGAMTRENLDAALIALGKKRKPEPPKSLKATLNTDAAPNLPAGFNLTAKGTKHRRMGTVEVEKRLDGQLYVNGMKVVRYLSSNQQNGKVIQGHKLRLELEKENEPSCLNATFRDFLLANPEFIPEDWESGYTYFWDTIAARPDGDLYAAYLYRSGQRWNGGWYWLDRGWGALDPAARLAS